MTAQSTPSSPEVQFTLAGIRRGFALGLPLGPAVAVYGAVFGVLASEAKLSMLESVLMSAFVYSGTAQLAALQGWSAAPLIVPLIATILVINARYMLYGAALRPWLGHVSPGKAYGSLFFLGDGNWVISMKEYAGGERDAGFVFGSGIASFLPWVGGTLVGHWLGNAVSDPARFGFDFMLVAFSTAMGVAVWKSKADLWPAGVAAVVALILARVAPGGWPIVGAGLAGALTAALRYRGP